MPRVIRNFWIELDVEGRKGNIATGPRARDGGFDLTIQTRVNGEIHHILSIIGTTDPDDPSRLKLCLLHRDPDTGKGTTGTTTYPR